MGLSDKTLRSACIRLAQANLELRAHLLPLLTGVKVAGGASLFKEFMAELEIIRRMGKILDTHRAFGSRDTEPEGVVIDVLESYLKLYLYRGDFPKTYDSLDRGYL